MRFALPRIVFALMMREMNTTYGRSALGYVWAILEPVAAIALLSIAFSIAFRSPALGVSFPLFYATGYLPFMFYSETTGNLGSAIQFNRQLLFYPRVTFMDALVARFALKVLTHALVFCIVISGIFLLEDTRAVIRVEYILSSLAMAAAFAFGIGVLNCFLFEFFPFWQRVWSIINRPMFIISTIFFTVESLADPFRTILLYNPLVHIVSEMRRGFYPFYEGVHVSYLYVYSLAIILAAAGFFLLKRYHRVILDI